MLTFFQHPTRRTAILPLDKRSEPISYFSSFETLSYIPSKFAEENLTVSDTIGHFGSVGFLYDRETFNNDLVMYVLAGTIYLEQYGVEHVLKAGDGVLMTLKDAHKYYSDKEDIGHIVFFHFRGYLTDSIVIQLSSKSLLPIRFYSEQVPEYFYSCFEVLENLTDSFEYDLSAIVFSAVLSIAKSALLEIQKADETTPNTIFANSLINYVNRHINDKITLEDMANCANLSKFHFCREFTNRFNVTPMEYVIRKKLYLARHLLTESELSIDEIAQSLSFSDQSHFSKTFKKFMGITPIRYRKKTEKSYLSNAESSKKI